MKKLISIFIALSMLLMTAPAFAISGSGTEANPYLISSAADIAKIHNDLGGYYKLTADINMQGVSHTPIGNESEGAFTGTIDGNGHTVSNLNINDEKYAGFVGYLEGSVKNFNLKNIDVNGYRYVGGVVGYGAEDSEVHNCTVQSGTVSGTKKISNRDLYTGGIVGWQSGGTVTGCTNYGTVSASGSYLHTGGIVGYNNSGTVTGCTNYGAIHGGDTGGIVGYNYYGTVTGCTNYGAVSGSYNGGIVGYNSSGTVSGCANYGKISGGSETGGIVGANSYGTVTGCINYGAVSGSSDTGGIVGYKISGTVTGCINYGAVSGSSDTGGIVGDNYGTVTGCINYGAVSGGSYYTGGIVGSGSMNNCYQLMNTKRSRNNGTLLTQEECRKKKSYKDFDFDDTWFIDPNTNSGFPQLRNLPRHMDLNECIELFEVGNSDRLYAYLDGKSESVTWTTDDASVATVSENGTVTAKKIGVCTVTATNSAGMKANCLIYVYGKAEQIFLNKQTATITAGSYETLTYTESPSVANETVYWTSDNEEVATVDQDGEVHAQKKGTANITATTTNSKKSAVCRVLVSGNPITSVSLSPTSKDMKVGESAALTASVSPSEYVGDITWKSSNPEIVTVDQNGSLYAKKAGTAVVSIESDTGKSAQCTVTVKSPVLEMSFEKPEITLEKGLTEKLKLNINPADTTDTISYSTSSSTYATVSSDGVVTAKNAGVATITATASSGKKAYCVVQVKNAAVPVASVTIDKTELIMTKADTKQLNATVLPADATEKELQWTSSDEAVATVSNTGVVTAVAEGAAIITATANNGMYHDCAVKVVSASGPAVVWDTTNGIPGGTAQVTANIVKNPGISAYRFTVSYDETMLTPVAIVPNPEFGGTLTSNLEDELRQELNVVWYADEDCTENGALFTVVFSVPATAEIGDTAAVGLRCGAKDICNTKGEYIALYLPGAEVCVREPKPGDVYEDNEITVYDLTLLSRYATNLEVFTARQKSAGDVNDDTFTDIKDVVLLSQFIAGWSGVELLSVPPEAAPEAELGAAVRNADGEAEIPVRIRNNPGIAGFRLELDYNPEELEILGITPEMDAFSQNLQSNIGQGTETVITWYQPENMTESGTMFRLRVKAKDPEGKAPVSIGIKPSEHNFCNQKLDDVIPTYKNGYLLAGQISVENATAEEGKLSCEIYADETLEGSTAQMLYAMYDEDGTLVQLKSVPLTFRAGKNEVEMEFEPVAYAADKLFIWSGLDNKKPLCEAICNIGD